MRKTKTKEIKKIIGYDKQKNPNKIQKSLYNRIKKAYAKTSIKDQEAFLLELKIKLN